MPHPSGARPRDPPTALVFARSELAALVSLVLRHCGLATRMSVSAADARRLLEAPTSLVVVDLSASDASSVLTHAASSKLASVALVDLESGGSSFQAFVGGADQVVRVPFTPDELAVRAAALLRRLGHEVSLTHVEHLDSLVLSLNEHVTVAGNRVPLSVRQNSLLYLLAANTGHAVSRHQIRRLVWGLERGAPDAAVDALVSSLARALGDHHGEHFTVQPREDGALLGPRRGS